MILYHAPGSCSEGLLCLLDLARAPFTSHIINFATQDQSAPAFLAVNPKGKVPALQLASGEIITEYPVISQYIAETFPAAELLPRDPAARRAALSLIEYVVSTLHMRGVTFVFRPARFSPLAAAHPDLIAHGRAIVADGYRYLSERLGDRDWFFDHPGAVEAAVYYLAVWAPRLGVDLPANLGDLLARLETARKA